MREATRSDNAKMAIYYADALLRTIPELAPAVVPVLAHFAEQKASNGAVKALLRSDPPWRDLFFAVLPESITDARTPLDLLMALRTTPAPPTQQDVSGYVDFLIQHKFYELAYYTWLQFLPASELRHAGLLFNGDFAISPSGEPFNWIIRQGAGVTVDIVPKPDAGDARALLVDFLYGRVDYRSVSELVVLPPGTYRFGGEYRGKIVGPRGMSWRIACAEDSAKPIGEGPMIMGVASTWTKTGFAFTVPPTMCRAQYVRLDLDARMASEDLVSGSILFDDLQISRAGNRPSDAAK